MFSYQVLMFGIPVNQKQIYRKLTHRNCKCNLDEKMLSFEFCAICGKKVHNNIDGFIVPLDTKDTLYYQPTHESNFSHGVVGVQIKESYESIAPVIQMSKEREQEVILMLQELGLDVSKAGYYTVVFSIEQ